MADRDPTSAGAFTIRDVAARAGVSTATVSNYFHNPHRMTAQTRQRIAVVVEELDFSPNDAASTLRRGRSPVVGYLTFELASARTPAIANAISERLARADLHVLSAVDGGDPGREQSYLRLFERQRVAGLIITPVADVEPQLARYRDRGLPSVLSARRARSPEQASVSVDHVAGGRLAAEHLLALGRRRLAFVTDTLELSQISDRFDGASRAVAATPGASLEVVWAPSRTVDGGEAAAEQLLARRRADLPDGIFCVNDLVAMGLCPRLVRDVAVPGDVAVVGYDDIEFARLGAVPLTSVRTPQETLGTTAAELLLEEIALLRAGSGPGAARRHVELTPELVVRASTSG